MPAGWELPREQQLKFELSGDRVEVQKYRLMVYIHGLRDVPNWAQSSPNKYQLEYSLLGQKIKVPLKWEKSEMGEDGLVKLSLERIKVFYLFAASRDAIKDYIKEN